MVRDVAFGQYFPGNSLMHKLDPRAKLLCFVAFIVVIFFTFNYASLGVVAAFTVFALISAGISPKFYFKSLKVILFVVIITSLLNLFYCSGEPIWEWWILKLTWNGIHRAVFVSVRIVCLILLSSCLTFTTSPTELTDAIERLMKPLKVIRFPVHEVAMMMSLALRFVPTLLEETDKIMQAQRARGADMDSGNFIKRAKALVPILIPLFVSAFRRAYDIATAMECRCYRGGTGRTRMKTLHMGARDIVSFVVTAMIIGGVIVCNILLTSVL